MFIALELSMIVEDAGFEPIGPAGDPEAALAILANDTPHAAILDINLGPGVTSAPVAEALAARGVPFIYLSGYNASFVSDNMPAAPLMAKPVDPAAIVSTVRSALLATASDA
ncbi:two component-response regulator receiver (CheY-like protein) [Stappia sp. 22II-S9-Z10]|nr:two component-response regulator receiver (CheY-like protein) [Stappia sp. 22II-S9-Z10]